MSITFPSLSNTLTKSLYLLILEVNCFLGASRSLVDLTPRAFLPLLPDKL